MTIFLDEDAVSRLLTMQTALSAVEEVFAAQGRNEVVNIPRIRTKVKGGILRITAGVLNYRGYYGVKISSTTAFGTNAGRLFLLYNDKDGALCAAIQVFGLGMFRTGAASGIATKYLALPDASRLGVIGSGRQAQTQVEAVCAVRPIREVSVYSRGAENRVAFCEELQSRLPGVSLRPVASAELATRGAQVLITATTATAPVVMGDWIAAGTHINAVGANLEHRRELDSEVVRKAAKIVTDDLEQVRYEATDLAVPVIEGILDWDDVRSLGAVVAGLEEGRRTTDDITIFKSLGVAIEDVALAARAYEAAVAQGVGVQLPNLAG
jgi:alanine dehydrogenase